jgi:hypothetical protein
MLWLARTSFAILLLANLATAQFTAQTATVAHDGRIVQVAFTAPLAVPGGLPDAGPAPVKTDGGFTLEYLGSWIGSDGTTTTWNAVYLSPGPLVLGQAVTVSSTGTPLSDAAGNAAAAFSLPTANSSVVDLSGFPGPFTRGGGGVDLYVSSSLGNDATGFAAGQNPATPYKTVKNALLAMQHAGQEGKGGAVHLLRGDTFKENTVTLTVGGQDLAHPFLLDSYWPTGTPDPGIRPVIAVDASLGQNLGLTSLNGGGRANPLGPIVIDGLDIQSVNDTGQTQNRIGIGLSANHRDLVISDTRIQNFQINCNVMLPASGATGPVTFLRSMILDSFSAPTATGGSAQNNSGLYADQVAALLLSQCTFDGNGRLSVDRKVRNIYSHNVYLQTSNKLPVVAWGNCNTNGGSHGMQQRPGGVSAYSYFAGNGLAYEIGAPGGRAWRNVVEGSENISPTVLRGDGLDIHVHYATPQVTYAALDENVVINSLGGYQLSLQVEYVAGATIQSALLRNNVLSNAGKILVDPMLAGVTVQTGNLMNQPTTNPGSVVGQPGRPAFVAPFRNRALRQWGPQFDTRSLYFEYLTYMSPPQ